ncbi:MAG: DNA-binding transcriptional regulator [Xanthomonadales bacterium]|nr:DNA-binding transcriptional regulator [Xanthomonadales bacterium]
MNPRKSRILSEVHETVHGLAAAGVISKRQLSTFDALCRLDADVLSPTRIRSLRRGVRVSQSVFAALLNTSTSTVQKWEIGEKHPSGPSLKLLNLIRRKGIEAVL